MVDEFAQRIREKTEKEINRRMEKQNVSQGVIDTAADEWDLSDYNSFFADCRGAGHDTSACGAIWNRLKDEGVAPAGGAAADSGDSGEEEEIPMPSAPGAETVEEARDDLKSADEVHLLVTTGCPTCNETKEALREWIDKGIISVQNVQESDLAADIVLETGISALPALVIENDGEYEPV